MTEESRTLIGHIIDVRGSMLTASLVEDEQGQAPTVTIGDEDILVGQLGAYVAVRQGEVKLLALVSRMTEQEKLAPLSPGEAGVDAVRLSFAQRVVQLVPVGTLGSDGEFERGVSTYPTTGAEVHAVGTADIEKMFSRYRSKGYEVGTLSSHPTLPVCLDPSSLFARHFAILGQTGAGKSWTVASLVQRAVAVMPQAHIIVLDLHGEYCWTGDDGERNAAFDDDVFRYVDARELEIPYWLMTYAELCDLLVDQTDFSAHNQAAVFREALNTLRTEEGLRLGLERATLVPEQAWLGA